MNKSKQTITKQQQKVITTAKKKKPKYKKENAEVYVSAASSE